MMAGFHEEGSDCLEKGIVEEYERKIDKIKVLLQDGDDTARKAALDQISELEKEKQFKLEQIDKYLF